MANPAPTSTPKKIPVKGKPMGIPMWGWVIAAVIGIVIGYTILKKSGGGIGGSVSGTDTDSSNGILAGEESSEGGGSIALPLSLEDILTALGLRGGTTTEPPPQSSPISEDSPAQQEAQSSAEQESSSDPIVQQLVSQGIAIAPEGTTVYDPATQQTYDVSGTPEFSSGNYNPNSPQGVLAMNLANQSLNLWNTATNVPMPGSTPVQSGYEQSMAIAEAMPKDSSGIPLSAGFGGFGPNGEWVG
jgi:hypothetical protein